MAACGQGSNLYTCRLVFSSSIMYALVYICQEGYQKNYVCYNRNAESKIMSVIRNDIKSLIDRQKLTRYRFWKDTGLNRETAYRLYDDPNYVPGAEVMDKIAKTYGWHPGCYLFYISDELATLMSA